MRGTTQSRSRINVPCWCPSRLLEECAKPEFAATLKIHWETDELNQPPSATLKLPRWSIEPRKRHLKHVGNRQPRLLPTLIWCLRKLGGIGRLIGWMPVNKLDNTYTAISREGWLTAAFPLSTTNKNSLETTERMFPRSCFRLRYAAEQGAEKAALFVYERTSTEHHSLKVHYTEKQEQNGCVSECRLSMRSYKKPRNAAISFLCAFLPSYTTTARVWTPCPNKENFVWNALAFLAN